MEHFKYIMDFFFFFFGPGKAMNPWNAAWIELTNL